MKKIMIILVLMISFFPFIDNVKAEETGYIGSCDCCTLTGTKEVETYSCSVMYDKYYDYSKGYSCSQVCSFGGILNGYSDRNSLRACPSNSNKQCEKKENLENISKENECKESGGTWEEGVCKKYYCYSCAENVRGQYTYGVKIWASSNEELKNKLIEYNNSKQNKIPITVEDCSVMENTPESQCYGDTTDENSDIIENENVDYITFTSSSTVRNFMTLIGEENINKLKSIKIISIGDITSKTIEEFDLEVYKQSDEATIVSMIDAISNDKNNLNMGEVTC